VPIGVAVAEDLAIVAMAQHAAAVSSAAAGPSVGAGRPAGSLTHAVGIQPKKKRQRVRASARRWNGASV